MQIATGYPYSDIFSTVRVGIATTAKKSWEALFDGVICGKTTWLSRTISNLTGQVLPPATAKVASTCIQAIPHAVAFLFMPFLPYIGFLTICVLGRISTPPEDRNPIDDMNVGQNIAITAVGARSLFQGAVERNPVKLLFGAGEMLGAFLMFLQAGFVNDVVRATKELHRLAQQQL